MAVRASRSVRRLMVCLLTLIALQVGARQAFAWGNEGHRIICQIALDRLITAGRALVDAIEADLGEVAHPFDDYPDCQKAHPDDGRPMTFQAGCIWADESRRDTFKGTYEYQFINVSNMFTTLDLARDCAALDCAVVGIQRYARYVALVPSTSSRERERRVLALRFLGHFGIGQERNGDADVLCSRFLFTVRCSRRTGELAVGAMVPTREHLVRVGGDVLLKDGPSGLADSAN